MNLRTWKLLSDRAFAVGFLLSFVTMLHAASATGGSWRHGFWFLVFLAALISTVGGLIGRSILTRVQTRELIS